MDDLSKNVVAKKNSPEFRVPIKVLHVIGSLGCGGAQVSLKYLVENADTNIFNVFVYPLRSRDVLIPINGKVIKLPYCNYSPRKFLAILKLCKKYHIDIIHAHLHKPIIASLLASFFCNVKVVVHERGPIFLRGLQYSIYRLLLRLMHHRAAVIIANSHITAERLIEKARIEPERIKIIYNAVDFKRFTPEHLHRAGIRKMLCAKPEDIVVGFVGRFNYDKGVDLLLKAMPLLLKESPRYLLVLVGSGSQEPLLKVMAEQLGVSHRVRFLGFRDNVAEILDAVDIGAVPSRLEPFGIVALEFMRSKIPLVCSGVDGLAELTSNGVTALVPVENTPQEICHSINRLANDRTLQKTLAGNAYHFVEKFSVSQHVKNIEQIYLELLVGKNKKQ